MGAPYNEIEMASFMTCSKGYMGECGIRGGKERGDGKGGGDKRPGSASVNFFQRLDPGSG